MTGVERPTAGTSDRAGTLAGVGPLLRLLTTLPRRLDDAVAVANGLFGDALDDQGSSLATPMTIRAGATVLPLERDALADVLTEALPDVGPRICLLVHGLMSTESVWQFPTTGSTTYGTLLASDHGITPLTLRYNTGRHISTNGRELARLLNRLVAAWPMRVREIDLIGHGMGGLIIRSACHYASAPWPRGRHPAHRPSLDHEGPAGGTGRGAEYRGAARGVRQPHQRRAVVAARSRHPARGARARPSKRRHQGSPLRRQPR